jgi:DNA transposition AAA+ family ATPase
MKDDIIKSFEQDARRVKERMLMGSKWENARDAANKLSIFLTEENWTQTAVAKKLGVSPAVINQLLQNKYEGDLEEITNKVINFINTYARKKLRDKHESFVETTVAKQIHTLITQTETCSDEEDEGKIGLVIGDSGHGKTKCLKAFAKANRNTVYVELDDGMNSTTMFNEIAEKLGIQVNGSLAVITRRLIEHLKPRNIIVILDEASGLRVRQLNQLRQIIVVKCRCPLILSGNQDLEETILRPTIRRGSESMDQFTSRLMYILNLDEIASDNNGGLYTVDDVRKLYEYGGIKLTRDAIKTLRTICKTPKAGRLRVCSHIISVLHLSKEAHESGQIDTDLIRAALNKLRLPMRDKIPICMPELDEEKTEAVSKTA